MNDKPRHWLQFKLRTLLLLPLALSLIFGLTIRAHQNRQQRFAAYAIWHMGGYTSDGPGKPFGAPLSGLDWVMRKRTTTWLDDLLAAPAPHAILFDGPRKFPDHNITKLTATIQRLPSVKAVFFVNTSVSPESIKKLQQALPHCQVSTSQPTHRTTPNGCLGSSDHHVR